MFTPVGAWDDVPPLFHRNGDINATYQYVGNCIFKSLKDGSYWKWAPEKRIPPMPERFDAVNVQVVEDPKARFWPAFTAIAEADPSQIPALRVSSTSIRNFEITPNGVSLIGVLHIPTGTIHLAPLVSRTDKQDVPSVYDKNFAKSQDPSKASLKFQDKQFLSGGRFVRPMEDTREASMTEKKLRKTASEHQAQQSWEQVQVIHGILNQLKKINGGKQEPVKPTKKQTPLTVTGTAHLQLQSTVTTIELEAMGFAIERETLHRATFTSTSGTLNTAHFGVIHLGDNWQRQIMSTIARDLRVDLVHQKATPHTPSFTDSNLRDRTPYQKGKF